MAMAGCSSVVLDRIGDDDDEEEEEDDVIEAPENMPEEVHEYLLDNNAQLYEGELEDRTGEDSITILNGAGDSDVAYDPPAVRIDAGTEVTWEWTGRGGAHNVESDGGDFEFENPEGLIDEEGHTWSYTFEEPGNALYLCIAHTAQGQHGAVIVE